MLSLTKGERTRIFSMIEDVSADDGPNKLEAYLPDGTSIKVYKVDRIVRVDLGPKTNAVVDVSA